MIQGTLHVSRNTYRMCSSANGDQVGREMKPGRILLSREEAERVILEDYQRSGAPGPVPALSRLFREQAVHILSTQVRLVKRVLIDASNANSCFPYVLEGNPKSAALAATIPVFWEEEF